MNIYKMLPKSFLETILKAGDSIEANKHIEALQQQNPDKALDVMSHVEAIHSDIRAELKRRNLEVN